MTEEERSWPSTGSPNFMIEGSNRYRRSFRARQKTQACGVDTKQEKKVKLILYLSKLSEY